VDALADGVGTARLIDLTLSIAALDSRYLTTSLSPIPMSCGSAAWGTPSAKAGSTSSTPGSYLFYSDDGLRSLHATNEVNSFGSGLMPGRSSRSAPSRPWMGRSSWPDATARRGRAARCGLAQTARRGHFQRTVVTEPAWGRRRAPSSARVSSAPHTARMVGALDLRPGGRSPVLQPR
jgi:hypothetical protein